MKYIGQAHIFLKIHFEKAFFFMCGSKKYVDNFFFTRHIFKKKKFILSNKTEWQLNTFEAQLLCHKILHINMWQGKTNCVKKTHKK